MAQDYSFEAPASDDLPFELLPYKQRFSTRFFEVRRQLLDFIREDVLPAKPKWWQQRSELEKAADHPVKAAMPQMHWELVTKAKERGLWNFFLPEVCGLSCLEYTYIQEILGAVPEANLAMNCMAPDTGNMEVLQRYGNETQKREWLEPLLDGTIRSAFAMTEPGVASSDATNIQTSIIADGSDYVINGHKWWISGTMRPECKVFILLGRTSTTGPIHKRFSMILVPRDAPGVNILRPLALFGHEHDHAEIIFKDVRVPKGNMLLEEGRGFEIAQGRLGPGRLHHCMRTLGQAEIGLQALIYRAQSREAFGQRLIEKGQIQERIAEFRMELTAARALCFLAACVADDHGWKKAKSYVSMIKVMAPRVALKILDEAIQVHGAHGLGQDCKLTEEYIHVRHVRFADGPDAVHLQTVFREEMKRPPSVLAKEVSGENTNVAKYGMFSSSKL